MNAFVKEANVLLFNALLSALVNLVLLVLIPLGGYTIYHKWRHGRGLGEILKRAGLKGCPWRYLGYAAAFALMNVAALLLFVTSPEPLTREGSAQHEFVGLGFSGTSLAMALLYGVVKTGFAEELLFRGLIAGSLGRRLKLVWANLWQALIFMVPHLPIVIIMPDLWWLLIIIFAGTLFLGWLRIKSDSILGSWLIHAALNCATCLLVAVRTAV